MSLPIASTPTRQKRKRMPPSPACEGREAKPSLGSSNLPVPTINYPIQNP